MKDAHVQAARPAVEAEEGSPQRSGESEAAQGLAREALEDAGQPGEAEDSVHEGARACRS